jgi:hypothetical protein
MTTMMMESKSPAPTPIQQFFKDVQRGSPMLWTNASALAAGSFICFALHLVDQRLINGVNVWDKPAKFFLSLAVQFVTVGWAMSLLQRPARGMKTASIILVAAAWAEMAYIVIRASRAELSHFNTGTPVAAALYSIMGVGALSLTATSAFIGWHVWQQRKASLVREATGFGLMLGALLGTIAGGVMSSMTSHWIGGDMTDATGTGFFGWSTTGGDLRVAHFIGLHAMQIIPFAAISRRRWVVYAVAAAVAVAMVLTFVMAINGIPVFRA